MSILQFNNSKAYFTFKDTDNFEYKELESLYKEGSEVVREVRALYINDNSMYGKAPLLVTSDCFVNLPSHMVSEIQDIVSHESIVQDINDGKVGFKIYKYFQKKYKKECYSIEWVEIVPSEIKDKEFQVVDDKEVPF